MTRVTVRPLAGASTLEGLRSSVAGALQDLGQQLRTLELEPQADLPMAGHRITNLSDPAAGRDAVNRNFLEKRLAEAQLGAQTPVTLNSATSTTTVVTTLAIQIAY